jgi:hypothetical protein
MQRSFRFRVALWAVCLGGLAGACDYSDQPAPLLQIISPENGATILDGDDTDLGTQGVQIDVIVEGEGEGHVLELNRLRGGPPERIATATLNGGRAVFTGVSLFDGSNSLEARDPRTGRSSLPITFYVQSPCRKIFFIEPKLPQDASELVLGPLDDSDGTPCGDSLSVRLIAATGLSDGSSVTLFAGDIALATQKTLGGVLQLEPVVFDKATLDALGEAPFDLALRVMGSACPDYAFEAKVRIDCAGPPVCAIQPLGASEVIGPSYDLDPTTPGVQLDVRVQSGDEARGQPVDLLIDDVPWQPPATVSLDDAAVAVFTKVSLPEGDVRLDAVCRDAVQNVTHAGRRSVTVDSLGCPLTITSPAADTVFTSAAPQVTVSATFTGGDCLSYYASVSASDSCPGLFTSKGENLAVGQSALTTMLTLLEPGPSYLCLGTRDTHGNDSQAALRVVLEEP